MGAIKISAGGKELDLRVSVIPTNHGQSVVHATLRIKTTSKSVFGNLGYLRRPMNSSRR